MTPYQRPLVMLLFLVVPLGLLVVVGSYLLTGEWFFDRFRYKKHESPEVQFVATETATSANELLFEFNRKLRDLDNQARDLFGLDHAWHDPVNERAPKAVYDFANQTGNKLFLKKYLQIAFDRAKHEKKLSELEAKVDQVVIGLSSDAKADHVMRADRLVQKEISNALEDVRLTQTRIDEIAVQYKKGESQ